VLVPQGFGGFLFGRQKMQVSVFNFDHHTVRTQMDNNGEPWFNANDVCVALGYENPRKAVADHVDSDDVTKWDAIDSLGRTQSSNHVNESGLYALIFGSKLPKAKTFKHWVTSIVLPSIRKTGMLAPVPKTRLELAKENVLLIEEIEAKDALLLEQAPKVAIYEILADRKQDVSTTLIAKQLGTTAIKLNQFLRESGVKWLNADLPKAGYSEWFNVVSDVKNGHEFHQCLITPLGQIEVTKLWAAK
jgi:prophage antirepressor-like protein